MLVLLGGLLMLAGCDQDATVAAPSQPAVSVTATASTPSAPSIDLSRKYMAHIQEHTEVEFLSILRRAEKVISEAQAYPQFEPIEFVLHGPEAGFFVRSNYPRYQEIVDLAARLDAFGVVDIKICEAWLSMRNVQLDELPAFVETVPYGPATTERLEREGYTYF